MPKSKNRRKAKNRPQRRRADSWRREWIGGIASTPIQLDDRSQPYRPVAVFWVERPSGRIVGTNLCHPDEVDGAVADALAKALRSEHPARPHAVRVATAELADEVADLLGDLLGDRVPITVAPTPEIAEVRDRLVESLGEPDGDERAGSYLGGGEIPPATVAAYFEAAAELYRASPWQQADDVDVLRLDIPALGVDGACVTIMGALGQSFGLLVFDSLADYESFAEAAAEAELLGGEPEFDMTWLGLDFERGADLEPSKRREISRHGWPVAAATAYPDFTRYGPGFTRLTLTARDLRIGAAAATAVARLFDGRDDERANGDFAPADETNVLDDDIEVRVRLPYSEEGGDLIKRLVDYAIERFGAEWSRCTDNFDDLDTAAMLAVPWSLFDVEIEGASVAQWYLRERPDLVSPAERAAFAAQEAAWMSVWEVIDVEPGESIDLVDLLSGETRTVTERTASRSLTRRDALLARITDIGGSSFIDSLHNRVLGPADAAEVVRLARGRLRRKRAVPVERLRDSAFGGYLIRKWEAQVAEAEDRALVPPRLTNTDGDEVLLTTDRFRIETGAADEVARRLAGMSDVLAPEGDDGEFGFLGAGGNVGQPGSRLVVGHGRIARGRLMLETNSVRRADDLRARVEAACGDLLRHELRDHTDPRSSQLAEALAGGAGAGGLAGDLPDEAAAEMRRIEAEYKERHYATWADQPLPALGGRTPREAVRTAEGRREVDVLLKEMEHHERRLRGDAGFDFSGVRRELGVE